MFSSFHLLDAKIETLINYVNQHCNRKPVVIDNLAIALLDELTLWILTCTQRTNKGHQT